MDCSLPGSFVHGIFQARILEWVAFPIPGDLPNPGSKPASLASSALAGGFFVVVVVVFYHWYHLGSPNVAAVRLTKQSCDLVYCEVGSSGIFRLILT